MCEKACPIGAITIDENKAKLLGICTCCGVCVSSCKQGAIVLNNETTIETLNIDEYKGILVFGEQKDGVIASVVFELVGEGRKLADKLNVELGVLVLGEKIEGVAKTLTAYGADIVYLVDNHLLKSYNDESYSEIVTQLIKQYKPEIVLFGATIYGRSLAPRVASRLNTGLTADCTELKIDLNTRALMQTRPAFGGNIFATIACYNNRPQMATVRPNLMKIQKVDSKRSGKVIRPEVVIPTNVKIKIIETVNTFKEMTNFSEAEIIVSAGRGIGDRKHIALLEELANVLGGVLGASRAVVDMGWLDYSYQIGQTGKTVSPKVYLACGISGSIQHIAGILSSDIIIAINKDPEAPIFKVARYGIVGDIKEVVPALIKEYRAKKMQRCTFNGGG